MQIKELKIELRPKCDEDQQTVGRLFCALLENKPVPLALAGHEMHVVIKTMVQRGDMFSTTFDITAVDGSRLVDR